MSEAKVKIKVAVCGAAGRMGREVVRALSECVDLELVAAIDHNCTGMDSGLLCGITENGVLIENDLAAALSISSAEVLVDFTLPCSLMGNIKIALANGASPVVGTTGISRADYTEIEGASQAAGLPVFVAPNFAIGAVLMMQFAEQAARYMPDVEIIELHHDRKLDSPSGTAILTAKRIGDARAAASVTSTSAPEGLIEKVASARGARSLETGDVPIHSIRLNGFIAHQEVIFGGPGQVLTIRHDSIDRQSFMPGVLLAVRKVGTLSGVVVGLEKLL